MKLIVEGIESETGKRQIERALRKKGATQVTVNQEEKTLQVEGRMDAMEVERVVQGLGFSVIAGH
ncbi:MAG: hypothetical protein HFJ86_10340 [Oscillospiraceae bacterium]|nr:hypothetical protein [Oscillospiraceae bacterium]